MIRMNDAQRGAMMFSSNIALGQVVNESRDIGKHRMTYERAGHIFRALQFIPDALKYVQLIEVDEMRLIPPWKNMRFAEWVDINADKLQLYDAPQRVCEISYDYNKTIYRTCEGETDFGFSEDKCCKITIRKGLFRKEILYKDFPKLLEQEELL